MKILAIVQARMGSTRYPNKVMKPLQNTPMIGVLLQRLAKSHEIDQIVVATSTDPRNQPLVDYVTQLGYACGQGSEEDVLSRYATLAETHAADVIVRITGDCPLIDPQLVDETIRLFKQQSVDYVSNIHPPTYPDGLDVEVFSRVALERAQAEAQTAFEREHVTPYLRDSGYFRTDGLKGSENLSNLRWTVDEFADFEVIKRIFSYFDPRIDFSWQEVWALQQQHPELFKENQEIMRNQGAEMGSGQKLWKRAKQIIPGGNMLLSKRAEMFLPEQWPAYFSKTQGCYVWDLDGNRYIDMSIMGVGTNLLGYSHPEVDAAVMRTVQAGNMSTFNCPEEVALAERLLDLHSWADMVRFARSGGEANAIAVRIARAASGKDKVAFCGYHGWHDWYLSANLSDEQGLNGHLLPGLEPKGVPVGLRNTVFPFNYNDYVALEELVRTHDIGVIKMEVMRNFGPENDFLQKVRQLATEKGIVLIFDECTSGFRQTFGGLHLQYGVEPDMAMFGKALGNGYAITATIGRREIMEAAQSTFISSTFWTERIGPTAALATLDVMVREQSWEQVTATGRVILTRWQQLAERYGLKITLNDAFPALASFAFRGERALAYKTLITQEMLTKGYLAGTSVYVCTAHTPAIVDEFFAALEPVFAMIAACELGEQDIYQLLHGPVCHAGFKRLN